MYAETTEFGCADSTDGGEGAEKRNIGRGGGNTANIVGIDACKLDGRRVNSELVRRTMDVAIG